jgi:DNA-binding response OmpR family regulator
MRVSVEINMTTYKILLVDDDHFTLETISKNLVQKGYSVTATDNGKKALELLKQLVFDLVITGLRMEGVDGIQILQLAKAIRPEVMVVFLTGWKDSATGSNIFGLDADDYLQKCCEPEEIYFRVVRCIETLELKRKSKFYETILRTCPECKKIRIESGVTHKTSNWISIKECVKLKMKANDSCTYCPECEKQL